MALDPETKELIERLRQERDDARRDAAFARQVAEAEFVQPNAFPGPRNSCCVLQRPWGHMDLFDCPNCGETTRRWTTDELRRVILAIREALNRPVESTRIDESPALTPADAARLAAEGDAAGRAFDARTTSMEHGPECGCTACKPVPLDPFPRSPSGAYDCWIPLRPRPCSHRHPDGERWCYLPEGHEGDHRVPASRELPVSDFMPRRER